MSTGLECEFVKVNGEYFLVLEEGTAPKQVWDWREFAKAYGPFRSELQARDFLCAHFANPGGYTCAGDKDIEPDEVLADLLKDAEKNKRARA